MGIALFLSLPALLIAAVMPMQALGRTTSPATAGDATLTLNQTDSADPVTEGDNVTYTMTVGNTVDSVGNATNTTLSDFMSSDVDWVSTTPSQGTCDDPVDGFIGCDLGTISPGNTATVALVVTTTDRCGSGGFTAFALTEPCDIFNDAGADSPDSIASPNSEEQTTVNPAESSSLRISKSDSPDPVQESNPLTYTIVVGNDGPADAANTIVTDHLPPGETFVSASTTLGSCSHTATTVTCHLGTLVPSEGGETVTIVVQAPDVASDTVITNTATVSASNTGDNSASEDTTVQVNDDGTTEGTVPPDGKGTTTFTTTTRSTPGGGPAVDGGDPTGVALKVPPHGPGGSVLLEELECLAAPCSGPRPAAAGVVLGNVVYNVVPPDGYPNNKPFKAILLYDASLNPRQGPVYYFKDGVTTHEIRLHTCGSTGPGGKAPCLLFNAKLHTSNPLTNGDWKVIVRLHSDPKMRK